MFADTCVRVLTLVLNVCIVKCLCADTCIFADVPTITDELAVTADTEGQDRCKLMIVSSICLELPTQGCATVFFLL